MFRLDAELNNKILKLAPKFDAMEYAPDTYERLASHVSTGSRLVVWHGASESTIYGDARVNHAFRAWHDALHLKLGAAFDYDGEKRVALEQARLIDSDAMARIILAEVVGQVDYVSKFGQFPIDQVEFVLQYLKGGF